MRLLVVGGGGREHALCWSLAQNPTVDRLYAAPGNAGIASIAECLRVPADDVAGVAALAEREGIDLTIVGPEAPLVAGLADELESRGLRVFGPSRAGARIEGSKAWTKELCERYGIPAARSRTFRDVDPAMAYLASLQPPYVVKADGLAAGKGVTVAEDRATAARALREALVDRVFGEAGAAVVVEEYLSGREVSALAVVDGPTVVPLALAQDHKRAFDGDRGPNTGGMGAFSPVPFVDAATERTIEQEILRRTARALLDEGVRYRGVLYAGLMLTDDGPKVLEFNCRFGDPETQVIVPRLVSNLGEVLLACVEGNLADYRLSWSEDACVGVVVASGGYPGAFPTGVPISGLAEAERVAGVQVFHSGTATAEGRVITSGGRVLTVSALAPAMEDARAAAYEACGRISFEGMHYRGDIAAPVVQRAH